ncbi:unnamed protein product [Chrysoparadoxa australica]
MMNVDVGGELFGQPSPPQTEVSRWAEEKRWEGPAALRRRHSTDAVPQRRPSSRKCEACRLCQNRGRAVLEIRCCSRAGGCSSSEGSQGGSSKGSQMRDGGSRGATAASSSGGVSREAWEDECKQGGTGEDTDDGSYSYSYSHSHSHRGPARERSAAHGEGAARVRWSASARDWSDSHSASVGDSKEEQGLGGIYQVPDRPPSRRLASERAPAGITQVQTSRYAAAPRGAPGEVEWSIHRDQAEDAPEQARSMQQLATHPIPPIPPTAEVQSSDVMSWGRSSCSCCTGSTNQAAPPPVHYDCRTPQAAPPLQPNSSGSGGGVASQNAPQARAAASHASPSHDWLPGDVRWPQHHGQHQGRGCVRSASTAGACGITNSGGHQSGNVRQVVPRVEPDDLPGSLAHHVSLYNRALNGSGLPFKEPPPPPPAPRTILPAKSSIPTTAERREIARTLLSVEKRAELLGMSARGYMNTSWARVPEDRGRHDMEYLLRDGEGVLARLSGAANKDHPARAGGPGLESHLIKLLRCQRKGYKRAVNRDRERTEPAVRGRWRLGGPLPLSG